MITQLNSNIPLFDKDLGMSRRLEEWTRGVTLLDPILGTGSPEGVIEAIPPRFYVDTAAGTGSILYVKRDADIAGDRTMGWILV